MNIRSLLILSGIATVMLTDISAQQAGVGYPTGYRDWTHVKSMEIKSGHSLSRIPLRCIRATVLQ